MESSEQELGLAAVEVTIASFDAQPGIEVSSSGGTGNVRVVPPVDRAGRFPAAGVAFRVVYESGLPSSVLRTRAARTPLSLASFKPSSLPNSPSYISETSGNAQGRGIPRSLMRVVSADGKPFTLVVWIGPGASHRERAALALMIESLSLPKPLPFI